MKQGSLDFAPPFRVARGRADFHVSHSNAEAVRWIDRWPEWPSPALLLFGPEGCGKSHLAQVWRERAAAELVLGPGLDETAVARLFGAGAVAVDDADRAPELSLLHLYNACIGRGGHMLLTARRTAGDWPVALPDLRSRLRAAAAVAVAPPDDALLAALLVKHFADRQLHVRPGVITFLVPRMERSFAAAAALAARLDAAGLGAKRPVGLALARQVLEAGAQPSSASSERGDR